MIPYWFAGAGACGVDRWEKVAGRTVIALREGDGYQGKVVGLKPLPTERGKEFIFADIVPEKVPVRGE